MDFRPGTRWGRYEIVGRIAVGGMAEIYRARCRGPAGFCKDIALKRMRPEFVGDPGFRRMFEREAAIAARLNHPNLVQAFDLVEQEGELALSMEFVPGISLRKLLAEGKRWGMWSWGRGLSIWLATYIAWGVARALSHAWNVRGESGLPMRLIHRDISPHNLLLSREGCVKLIDFGIARPIGEQSDAGVVKGKLLYMSPEQLVGGALDARTDLYSLGIVLYESALGLRRPLFDAETEPLVRAALLKRRVVPPARFDPDFPKDLSDLIMRALDRDPDRRFDSAAAMACALEEVIARHWRSGSLAGELARLIQRQQQVSRLARQRSGVPSAIRKASGQARVVGVGLAKSAGQWQAMAWAENSRHRQACALGRTRVAVPRGMALRDQRQLSASAPVGPCLAGSGENGPAPEGRWLGAGARTGSARDICATPSERVAPCARDQFQPPWATSPPGAQGPSCAVGADERLPPSRAEVPLAGRTFRGFRRVGSLRSRACLRRQRRPARAAQERWAQVSLRRLRSGRSDQRPWKLQRFSRWRDRCLRNAPYALAMMALLATFWSLSADLAGGEAVMSEVQANLAEGRAASHPMAVPQRLASADSPQPWEGRPVDARRHFPHSREAEDCADMPTWREDAPSPAGEAETAVDALIDASHDAIPWCDGE